MQVTFSGADRGKALGIFGSVIGIAAIAGQLLGGLLLGANLFGLTRRRLSVRRRSVERHEASGRQVAE